ncbi:hypothetical protein NEOKW01_1519 [Nematocida sp. AWRm80]|nr:hypothetical protein NEOKW01_1519 [Nematocida sp. AWRm80]
MEYQEIEGEENSLYNTLRIRKAATAREVREAYKKVAKTTHPDRGRTQNGMFEEANKAYTILSHTKLRTLYNIFGNPVVSFLLNPNNLTHIDYITSKRTIILGTLFICMLLVSTLLYAYTLFLSQLVCRILQIGTPICVSLVPLGITIGILVALLWRYIKILRYYVIHTGISYCVLLNIAGMLDGVIRRQIFILNGVLASGSILVISILKRREDNKNREQANNECFNENNNQNRTAMEADQTEEESQSDTYQTDPQGTDRTRYTYGSTPTETSSNILYIVNAVGYTFYMAVQQILAIYCSLRVSMLAFYLFVIALGVLNQTRKLILVLLIVNVVVVVEEIKHIHSKMVLVLLGIKLLLIWGIFKVVANLITAAKWDNNAGLLNPYTPTSITSLFNTPNAIDCTEKPEHREQEEKIQ